MPTLLERLRKQGFNEGVRATAKHLKVPVKSTLKSLQESMQMPQQMPAQEKPAAAPKQMPAQEKPAAAPKWLSHLNEYRAKHGGSMKDAMVKARDTYKK